MSGAAISWRSKKQTCVALSTAEAENMPLASAAQEAIWMRQLLTDLRNNQTAATQIFEDNQSAICLAKNPQTHWNQVPVPSGTSRERKRGTTVLSYREDGCRHAY